MRRKKKRVCNKEKEKKVCYNEKEKKSKQQKRRKKKEYVTMRRKKKRVYMITLKKKQTTRQGERIKDSWLVGFYGISTFVGYLMPNQFYTIQFTKSTQFVKNISVSSYSV